MHMQHLICRVKRIKADLLKVGDELEKRGLTVMAEELRSEARSMEGVLIPLREVLSAMSMTAEEWSAVYAAAAAPTTGTRQFLSDVVTAAGLLRHGKTDKALAQRISDGAYALMGVPEGPNAKLSGPNGPQGKQR